MKKTKTVRAILLDIEGTTSSISFVYDVMFPYIRENLATFLQSSWDSNELRNCLPVLAKDVVVQGVENPTVEQWLGDESVGEKQRLIESAVNGLMDADVKATGLKQLQGLIWKNGFRSGQMVAHLFDDVAEAIRRWHADGRDIRIYSSGSIASQKLFFGHTVAGDLLEYLNGHYDTTTGPKREPASYEKIATEFGLPASEIVFVSDLVEELEAAKTAGYQTVLSVRPGNKPVAEGHGFLEVGSFLAISFPG